MPSAEGKRIQCVAGENACPPEDVGGPHAYFDFLAASVTRLTRNITRPKFSLATSTWTMRQISIHSHISAQHGDPAGRHSGREEPAAYTPSKPLVRHLVSHRVLFGSHSPQAIVLIGLLV